jgi:hypothetical protein
MSHARAFPLLQKTLASRNPQPHVDEHLLQAIEAYTSAMTASVDAYKRDMQALFAEHSAHTSALIAMQQQYISDKNTLHEQQMQDLINSFQLRYEHLESQLTAEQMHNFRRHMKEAYCGLDLWDDANDASGSGACSMQSIHDFMQAEPPEDIPPFSFPGEMN